MGKGQLLNGKMAQEFTQGLKPGCFHLAHYITTCSTPSYEGLGDLNTGLLAPDIVKNRDLVACFGMSMSFEADVINHYHAKPVRYLPLALITNVIPKVQVPTLKALAAYAPNPTSHQEVLAAQKQVMGNFLPAFIKYSSSIKV
jgi:hypothetical protein